MAVAIKGNTVNANPTPGKNFYQFTHNQNTGAGGLLIIQLTMSNARSYTGCNYGGVSMTQLYTINRGGLSQRMAFYYLVDPPTGNNTLRINFNNSVWNPISIHSRSFTGSDGIGNDGKVGGQSTPNTQSLTVSQDSLIMATACSINAISTIQIPQGSNRTFATHNTNRQVGTGAISSNSGHNAGSISVRTTSTFGSVTNDRVEILGTSSADTTGGDFFMIM
tara:strand:+ start:2319 stop:2981 length:663 start_codon:yes stop_codon:yes gene_type:complete